MDSIYFYQSVSVYSTNRCNLEAQMDADEMYNVDYARENRNHCACCVKCCSYFCGRKKLEKKRKLFHYHEHRYVCLFSHLCDAFY